MRLAHPALVFVGLLVAAACSAAEPDPRSPKDLFGRPRPHGEPVKGAFVGLYAGRTNLFFGQPLRVELFAVSTAASDGPAGPNATRGSYVHPSLDGVDPNTRLELTDSDGRPVPFKFEFAGSSGSISGLEIQVFQLWPTPAHAVGVYWKPGTYRLRAVVEKKDDPTRPHSRPGTFRSNELTLTIATPGTPLDRCEPDAATRERVAKLIAVLDGPSVAERDAAEQALAAELDPAVLLMLDAALATATPEARRRLESALKAHDDRLRRAAGVRAPGQVPVAVAGEEFWHWVGGLDAGVSERLRKRAGFDEAEWRTKAARFAPVTVSQERPLTPDEAAKLLADLRHADPWVRMLAVRSVPRGAPAEVRAALVERFADPYREWYVGPGDPSQFSPILPEAVATAGRLGEEMIEPLVAFASREANRVYRRTAATALGQIGPDPKAKEFLRGLIGGPIEDQLAAVSAANAWGKDGLELLRELATAPGVHVNARSQAVAALGRHGDTAVDGPIVHKLLAERQLSLRMAAARAVGVLRYKEALPDLERIARDPAENQNTRYGAIDGVLAMVDEKAGNQLLLDLTARKNGGAVRSFAMSRLGQRKVMAALPILLEAVADDDWFTRTSADSALRGLAGLREGVGYDPRNPEPRKWREYWAKKQ